MNWRSVVLGYWSAKILKVNCFFIARGCTISNLKSFRFLIKLQFHAWSSSDTMNGWDLRKKSSYDVGLLGLGTIVHNDIIPSLYQYMMFLLQIELIQVRRRMQQEKLARARADKRVVEVSVLDIDPHFYGEDMFFILVYKCQVCFMDWNFSVVCCHCGNFFLHFHLLAWNHSANFIQTWLQNKTEPKAYLLIRLAMWLNILLFLLS